MHTIEALDFRRQLEDLLAEIKLASNNFINAHDAFDHCCELIKLHLGGSVLLWAQHGQQFDIISEKIHARDANHIESTKTLDEWTTWVRSVSTLTQGVVQVVHLPHAELRTLSLLPLRGKVRSFGVVGVILVAESEVVSEELESVLSELHSAMMNLCLNLEQVQYSIDYEKLFFQFERLTTDVHRPGNLKKTGKLIVESTRDFLKVDRVTLIVKIHQKVKVLSISGLEHFQSQGEQILRIEKLARYVMKSARSMIFDGVERQYTDEINSELMAYVRKSQSRYVEILPVYADQPEGQTAVNKVFDAVLVVEKFENSVLHPNQRFFRSTAMQQIALSLDDASLRERIWGSSFWLWLGTFRQNMQYSMSLKLWSMLVMIILVVLGMLTFTYPRHVHVEGYVVAQRTSHLYAPRACYVQKVLVKGGDRVQKNQTLFVLDDVNLTAEIGKLWDLYQQQQTSIQMMEQELIRTNSASRSQIIQYQAELSKAKILAESLLEEIKLLGGEKEKMEVKAPHDGLVLSYQIEQRLPGKPVRMGEQLLEIADLDSSRELEIRIEERYLGYVERALTSKSKGQSSELGVKFRLRISPEQIHYAELSKIPATNIAFQHNKRYILCRAPVSQSSFEFPLGGEVQGVVICEPEPIASLMFAESWRQFKMFMLR